MTLPEHLPEQGRMYPLPARPFLRVKRRTFLAMLGGVFASLIGFLAPPGGISTRLRQGKQNAAAERFCLYRAERWWWRTRHDERTLYLNGHKMKMQDELPDFFSDPVKMVQAQRDSPCAPRLENRSRL